MTDNSIDPSVGDGRGRFDPAVAPADRFDPLSADLRWQRAWADAGTFTADSDSPKPKSYILEMFP